jgi:2-polyprenyl-3-methyl-5-hydroxy-6-metoxy-1,4-benzoquinol methylase
MIVKSKSTGDVCPVCLNAASQEFVSINDVPIFCNVLWDSHSQATDAAKGNIHLNFCPNCAHVYNRTFDPSRVQYDSSYENSLHYSPVFRRYLADLAERLTQRYHLYKKDIIEIGCGTGDFLRLFSEKGGNRCIGFEPSFDELRVGPNLRNSNIEIVRDYYSEKYSEHLADFVACRQVLEHIVNPRNFLSSIQRSIAGKDSAVIFFEVPNLMYTLEKRGIWDLIYEHCGYYSAWSLDYLFDKTGFESLEIYESFGGQYMCIEAKLSTRQSGLYLSKTIQSKDRVESFVNGFADLYQRTVGFWKESLQKMKQQGVRVVVWGAGSKGITFLNVLHIDGLIDYVVDINPHKQGRYIPGTGQRVISPDALVDIRPQVIITMNPLYTDEIKDIIARFDFGEDEKPMIAPVDRLDIEKADFA